MDAAYGIAASPIVLLKHFHAILLLALVRHSTVTPVPVCWLRLQWCMQNSTPAKQAVKALEPVNHGRT